MLKKKEKIGQQVFPEHFPVPHDLPLPSLKPLSSSSLPKPVIIEEEELCSSLIKGDAQQLRRLLDFGMSPDYVLTKDVIVENFICKAGYSLLLLVLQACVSTNDFFYYLECVFVLFEKQVNLEKECLGTTPLPLFYICEHGNVFPEDVVLCFLTSVSKMSAFNVISKISNLKYKERITSLIRSEGLQFRFEPIEKETEPEIEIQRIKEDLLAVSDIYSIGTIKQPMVGKGSTSKEESLFPSVSLGSEAIRFPPGSSPESSSHTVDVSETNVDKE